jgi:hypothetical protein
MSEPDSEERYFRGPFAEWAAALSDRAVRRVTGATAYLRAVHPPPEVVGLVVDGGEARASIRAFEGDHCDVHATLVGDRCSSKCSCDTSSRDGLQCPHVAALLMAVRQRMRGSAFGPLAKRSP